MEKMTGKNYLKRLVAICFLLLLSGCRSLPAAKDVRVSSPQPAESVSPTLTAGVENSQLAVSSPDGQVWVTLRLDGGTFYYQVSRAGVEVIKPSRLGFTFKEASPLNSGLVLASWELHSFDETWVQPWGEVKEIRNHYNELRVELEESTPNPRRMVVVFRVYDDGLGFRYELPEQVNLAQFEIMDEETEFVLTANHLVWRIPAYNELRYELLYRQLPVHEMKTVHTPLTMETSDGLFLSIHEAALTDYAAMTLTAADENTLLCELGPWFDGVKVRGSTPHQTPWRTIQIAERAGDLITSNLILNLNEPNKLGDVSWVRPGKYVGIWWSMHIGKDTLYPGPWHGATTRKAKRYIDFAAQHGFDGVLVEGWNLGWSEIGKHRGEGFYFTGAYMDFDLEEVTSYAAAKGVKLIGHHETMGGVANYERQMEDAFQLYSDLGVDTVKTGYAGCSRCIRRYDDEGELIGIEWHHGQYMVEHYRRVVETAARYGIMLDVHEPIKDTGIRRTYPNMMTREGARGQEYNAWSWDGGNPPEHTTILPFTRLLSGPMDFTPGIFDLFFDEYRPDNRVNTTLAKQLALYVVVYSPLQMAADLPENYEGHPAFQFIKDVPVDWQVTRVPHAQIGDYVTIARQDRNSDDWYIGSITDEEGRTLEMPLDFLEEGVEYVAEIYADGLDAHWESNPLSIDISRVLVDSNTVLQIRLAPGGGQAIRISPAKDNS
jgi:alpha-glucosidase